MKQNHSDRLKINIWNNNHNYVIKVVKYLYNINKEFIIRSHGGGKYKRYEVWCQSRQNVVSIFKSVKEKGIQNKDHVSIGKT